MADLLPIGVDGDDPRKALSRLYGSLPWLKSRDKKHYRAKLFKSGNSLAVRLPAGTKLVPGMEMDLTIEDGEFLSLHPIERPKRKFDIAKVAGSAHSLELIKPEDRLLDERALLWNTDAFAGDPDGPG